MRLFIFLVLCFSHLLLQAQISIITGIVTDQNNKPITNAQIDVVGKNGSTITDNNGKFVLTLRKTAKGDLIVVRISKSEYIVSSTKQTASELPITIQLRKLKGNTKSKRTVVKSSDTGRQTVNAPNAQIVTMNQSGGNNTVINNYDSSEVKQNILKSTPPKLNIVFSLDSNSSLMAGLRLLNDVPIYYRFILKRADNIMIHHGSFSIGPTPIIYKNGGKVHNIQIENFLDSQFPHDTAFRVNIEFIYASIYYEEMELPTIGGTYQFVFDIDLRKHTLTKVQ